jgi:hypothetical protein
MFKNINDGDLSLSDINLQLKSFVKRKLTEVKFKEIGNTFLLVFSNGKSDDTVSIIQLFNCFMFNGDGIHELSITEIFLKKLGVFALEYCNRHGIDGENFLEFRIIIQQNDNPGSQKIKSLE